MDTINRQMAIESLTEYGNGRAVYISVEEAVGRIEQLSSAQPELDIGNDGTLYISVSKGQLDKINRVLIEEDGSIFCKQFY